MIRLKVKRHNKHELLHFSYLLILYMLKLKKQGNQIKFSAALCGELSLVGSQVPTNAALSPTPQLDKGEKI